MEGKNACYSAFDGTATGYGPGYQNACIHSGSNDYSGGDTVWYNYAIASAGTIISENTTQENPASNTTKASESVCPKGWTLPSKAQIQSIGNNSTTYVSSFNSVLGGNYYNGVLYRVDEFGTWWSSEANNGAVRRFLRYFKDGNKLQDSSSSNPLGIYIRCVPKS